MRKILTTLLLALCVLTASAQGVDPILTQLLQENAQTVALGKARKLPKVSAHTVNGVDTLEIQRRVNVNFHPDGSIRQLCILGTLADGESVPQAALDRLGIHTVCTVGQLVIMDVPAEAFDALSQMRQFKWLAADRVHQVDNDRARESNTVSYVADPGVPDAAGDSIRYDGSGVVVGVIDIGIDFNHVAFQDAKGNTRIKRAVTFTAASNNPIVTNEPDSIANLTTGNMANSHGTHTSATTAGSYSYARGMAPGADLVLCDCSNTLSDAHLIASAKQIVDYARTVEYTDTQGQSRTGKPCVINFSIGLYDDFHDGSDDVSVAFSSLTQAEGTPVIFCVSAGNEGNQKVSIVKTLKKDEEVKTVLGVHALLPETNYPNYVDGLDVFIYSTDGNPFTVEYKAVKGKTGTTYSLTDRPLVLNSNGTSVSLPSTATKRTNGKYAIRVEAKACHFTDSLRLGIFVKAGADNQQIVIVDKDKDLFGVAFYPALVGYTDGNADMSINTKACSDDVISVGSYLDRNGWRSIDGKDYYIESYNANGIGAIAPYSSYGIDDHGKSRPDILATGMYISSAYNVYDTTYFQGADINSRVPIEGKVKNITQVCQGTGIGNGQRPYFYGAKSGTSMACPMVTGIVALWLQKDPTLTTARVRELLQQSAIQDQYTVLTDKIPSGNLVQAGLGKIDALRGMKILENASRTAEQPKLPLDETLTMARNITTFSSANMLDFRNPNGPKAYVASGFDGSTLTFSRVLNRVPVNTGLLITAAEGSYDIPIAPASKEITTNYLHGTADGPVTLANAGEAYVLSSMEGQIGFFPNAAGLTVPQYKAYLVLPSGSSVGSKPFGFVLDETEDADSADPDGLSLPEEEVLEAHLTIANESGIHALEAEMPQTIDLYDLSGRRVSSPRPGLYLMNGRKVLFK